LTLNCQRLDALNLTKREMTYHLSTSNQFLNSPPTEDWRAVVAQPRHRVGRGRLRHDLEEPIILPWRLGQQQSLQR